MRRTISDVRAGVIESRAPAILNRRKKVGVIGGKGSRDRAHANLGRMPSEIKRPSGVIGARAPPITPTISGRRKVIIETIARSKTRLNLGRVPSEMGRPSGVIGARAPARDMEGGISAIVNSIMRMIFGK